MIPRVVLLVWLAASAAAPALGQSTSLFGRRASALETEPSAPADPKGSAKPAPEPDDPFAPQSGAMEGAKPKAEPDDPFDAGHSAQAKPKPKAESDVGVRIRPVEVRPLSSESWAQERVDFRLAFIGHPLAKVETPARFADAWLAFRQQHRRLGDGFERLPAKPESVSCRLLQDLGEGRWLVGDTRVQSLGSGRSSRAEAAPGFQSVLVLADGRGKVGERITVTALRVGSFDIRFDCEVPPAAGRRITLRRVGYVESPVLPDDEATREAFRSAVAAGAELSAVVAVERDCRACNGLGYLRRRVPGKIQDARDPCGACGSDGKVTPDIEHVFKP